MPSEHHCLEDISCTQGDLLRGNDKKSVRRQGISIVFKVHIFFALLLTGTTQDRSKVEISQNFVAFSEYMNFKSNDFESSKECHLPAKIFCKLDRYTERSSLWPLKRPQRQCFLEKKSKSQVSLRRKTHKNKTDIIRDSNE